jgi:hypothetical protein
MKPASRSSSRGHKRDYGRVARHLGTPIAARPAIDAALTRYKTSAHGAGSPPLVANASASDMPAGNDATQYAGVPKAKTSNVSAIRPVRRLMEHSVNTRDEAGPGDRGNLFYIRAFVAA